MGVTWRGAPRTSQVLGTQYALYQMSCPAGTYYWCCDIWHGSRSWDQDFITVPSRGRRSLCIVITRPQVSVLQTNTPTLVTRRPVVEEEFRNSSPRPYRSYAEYLLPIQPRTLYDAEIGFGAYGAPRTPIAFCMGCSRFWLAACHGLPAWPSETLNSMICYAFDRDSDSDGEIWGAADDDRGAIPRTYRDNLLFLALDPFRPMRSEYSLMPRDLKQ